MIMVSDDHGFWWSWLRWSWLWWSWLRWSWFTMIMVIMSSSTDRLNCWQRQEVSCSATASSNTCSIQDEVMISWTIAMHRCNGSFLKPSQCVRCCHMPLSWWSTTDQRDTWSSCTCRQIRWYCTWENKVKAHLIRQTVVEKALCCASHSFLF